MGYFKDISESLSRKYPDRKVFVISDQHFDHKNIIYHTRIGLFGLEGIDDIVDKMNKYIVSKHNEIVGEDDIVLILGDFSFKTGTEKLTETVSKLNGHKFLVMGNHDLTDKPDLYLKAGFEEVFINPIKFNGDYYSHYPLNASIESGDRPNTIIYKHLCEEFKSSDSGINFYGHQHILINNGKREKNVTCEQTDYKPLFVGRTKSYIELSDTNYPYLGEEFFDTIHRIISKYNHLSENIIINDYLYTIILELLTPYKNQIVASGSYMLNKKYNTNYNNSDLDITRLYDSTKTNGTNKNNFKKFANEIYEKLIQIEGINSDFYKKIDFICILSFIYATKNNRYTGYLDMNILLDDFYKSEDFTIKSGISLTEQYADKLGINNPSTIKYPRFSIQTTNALADIVNYYLYYIYTTDKKKKALLLKKINRIMANIDVYSQIDLEKLQNMFIRFLLRNIYFYESGKRKKDSNLVLEKRNIEIPSFNNMNSILNDYLRLIVNNKEYNSILESIYNSNNRKEEISHILTLYK